jgi:CRP/FNR family cyclic AMP-dependent transcriptional regulator
VDWPLLASLSEPDRRAVLAGCRRQRFKRNEAVFREEDVGDCVHLLAKGTVAVRISTPRGDVATLDVLRAGDAFGEQALIGAVTNRSATVVALEPTETLRLGRDDFDALLAKHPGTAQLLVGMLDARLRATSQSLVEALYLSAEGRVYRRLARLAAVYDGRADGAIPITQDDLASMTGATRQTVNKVLREAQDDGLLVLARGSIEILDSAKLARRAR